MTGRLDFGHETAAIAVLRAGFDGRPRPAPKTVRLYLGRVVDAGFRSWRKHGRFGERPTPDDELREVLQGA